MQLEKELIEKIKKAKQNFTEDTLFLSNYLKCSLATRMSISSLISENGEIEGLSVLIDYSIPEGELRIGMGQGPTYKSIFI
jgi:hypothetical protein